MEDLDRIAACRSQTKLLILRGFQQLLETTRFEDISVRDVASVCGVSRTTFYHHFKDKYDLFCQWIQLLFLEFTDNAPDFRTALLQNLKHAQAHQEFFQRIIVDNHDLFFISFFYQGRLEFLTYLLKKASGNGDLSSSQHSAAAFFVTGLSQLWTSWIQDGCQQSPETMVDSIINCMPGELRKLPYFQ